MPTQEEWRNQAQQWVPAFMAEYPTITAADTLYVVMRNTAYYVPRRYVRDEWRTRKAETDYMDIVNRLGDDDLIPERWMRGTDLDYKENYIYKLTITGIDASSKQPIERTITIESDKNMEIGDILDRAWGLANFYGADMIDTIPNIEFIEAMYT